MNDISALYVRVSTMNQIDRDSLQTQKERLIAYCTANGINEYKIYQDAGVSARDTNRPQLKALLNDIKFANISKVFVVKLDRITRSIKDLIKLTEYFKKYNIQFAAISESIDTSTAMGRAMQFLLGVFAQLERETTAERVSTDMHHRAKMGKWNGGVIPYGYTTQKELINKYKKDGKDPSRAIEICPDEKKLFIDPDESKIVKKIYDLYLTKNSVRNTTITLNNLGIKTRKGDLWSKTTIHRILTNPLYVGDITYGKRRTDLTGKLVKQDENLVTIVEGEHKAIISTEDFNKAKESLSTKKGKRNKSKRIYMLAGILKCGHCGKALTGHTFTKKTSGKVYSYYKCYSKIQKGNTACKGVSLPSDEIEKFIIENLKDLSKNKPFLSDKQKMLKLLKTESKENSFEVETDVIDKNIKVLLKRKDTLLDKMELKLIADEDLLPRYQKVIAEIENLENQKIKIKTMESSKQRASQNLETSIREIQSFDTNWDYLNESGKALRIKSVVKEIRATQNEIEMDLFLDVANKSRTGSHAGQNCNNYQTPLKYLIAGIYPVKLKIPKCVFNKYYPKRLKSYGDYMRKARIDEGLKIKEFALIMNVSESTIINWEVKNVQPSKKNIPFIEAWLNNLQGV
jgi:site-specific DNA recombinase